jgi:hypothetical protein
MRLPIWWTSIASALFLTLTSSAQADALRSSTAHAPASAPPSASASASPRASANASANASPSTSKSGVEATSKWVVDRADNICGLDDAKMLSKPAKVDYDSLLKATSEMKKLRDDKIDANSPEGIRLRQAAVDRVRTACDKVRVAEGYCSVWKQIRHQDGRTIPDITDSVKAQL